MPKKGLLAGSKITKSHSTIIPEAAKLITYAKTLPEIDKIVPSEIVPLKPSAKHLKFSPIQAGLKLAIRGLNARQVVFVYTKKASEVTHLLSEFWHEHI